VPWLILPVAWLKIRNLPGEVDEISIEKKRSPGYYLLNGKLHLIRAQNHLGILFT